MGASPIGLRAVLEDAGFTYDEEFISRLIGYLAGAQAHRISVKSTQVESVTRSTALVALNALDNVVSQGIREAGADWSTFCESVALVERIKPKEVNDIVLYDTFEKALYSFRERHPERKEADAGNITLAICEMAVLESIGSVGNRLIKAGANLEALIEIFFSLLGVSIDQEPGGVEQEEAPEPVGVEQEEAPETVGVEKAETPETRPTVWLLQYKEGDRPAAMMKKKDPGPGIEWRSTIKKKGIEPGDPVIYWRGIKDKKSDRGGLVGTGRFTGGKTRSETIFDRHREASILWHYYPTAFTELFVDDLLERDPLIKATGLKLGWGTGSIIKVPPQMADKIDAYLISKGHRSLFEGFAPTIAPEITFIGDAPKMNEDYLGRGDLAFVLATRINRVWDEATRNKAETPDAEQGSRIRKWIKGLRRWSYNCGLLQQRRKSEEEKSFVVHIDAPWGGGKTTFANYLSRILNPYSLGAQSIKWLDELPLQDERFWPASFRRPWHVVSFNAWQHQHLDPPWWCFYQAIRRQCFKAILTEKNSGGSLRNDRKVLQAPIDKSRYRSDVARRLHWLGLWTREVAWRVFNPKVRSLILIFVLTIISAVILQFFDLFKPIVLRTAIKDGVGNLPVNELVATGLVILTGGASAIWSVFAALTQSLLPGTPDAARNYSLGSGDPIERFRNHFNGITWHLRRPILVVIDDIDRCEPRFVVELLRGIQTIFNCSRVVFVLLGDRDWIEHAFANVHAAMKDIDVGPEHSFGGRFVEKSIQLSLILPDISSDGRTEYVQQVLGVTGDSQVADTDGQVKKEDQEFAEKLNDIINIVDPTYRDEKAKALRDEVYADDTINRSNQTVAAKFIDRKLALRSAADHRTEKATQHRLVPIAAVLPPNPRQIKRIINGIAFFQEIARIEQEIQPDSPDWCKLALWVVIMTEWPRTWATLSTYPGLLDKVRNLKTSDSKLPDEALTKTWVDAIKKNQAVTQLLNFSSKEKPWRGVSLDGASVEKFRTFMPAPGGNLLPSNGEK